MAMGRHVNLERARVREYIGYRRTPHLKVYKCVLREREREREKEREKERDRDRERERQNHQKSGKAGCRHLTSRCFGSDVN